MLFCWLSLSHSRFTPCHIQHQQVVQAQCSLDELAFKTVFWLVLFFSSLLVFFWSAFFVCTGIIIYHLINETHFLVLERPPLSMLYFMLDDVASFYIQLSTFLIQNCTLKGWVVSCSLAWVVRGLGL